MTARGTGRGSLWAWPSSRRRTGYRSSTWWVRPIRSGGTGCAILGSVALPIAGWALLRRVPIGLSAVTTVAGAVLGGLAGEWWRPFNPSSNSVPGVAIGILLGYLLATVALAVKYRHVEAATVNEAKSAEPAAVEETGRFTAVS
jgi:hypothetical protein